MSLLAQLHTSSRCLFDSGILTAARRTSTPRAGTRSKSSTSSGVLTEKLEKYAAFQPSPVSIQHFIDFGHHGELEASFLFLRREVPVRLANITKELQLLPKELKEMPGAVTISKQYLQSFQDILAYEKADHTDQSVLKEFTKSLINIRERHEDTVILMARAVFDVKAKYDGKEEEEEEERLPKFQKNIQYFLDRLYTSRISTRMLINQHTLLFEDPDSDKEPRMNTSGYRIVGAIDPNCSVIPIVERAYENARFLAEQYYMIAPGIEVKAYDFTKFPNERIMPPDWTPKGAEVIMAMPCHSSEPAGFFEQHLCLCVRVCHSLI